MSNIFNEDFRDFIEALNIAEVKYLLVGGFSVILHGYSRTTGDMDIWVEKSNKNYTKIKKAFDNFGMPVFDMTEANFLNHPNWDVFTFGVPPSAIDMMVKLKGLNFDKAYERSINFEDDGLLIKCINFDDLIKAKNATSRPKDIDDIQNLTK
ncbi:hypothetical protein A5893_13670 [Pedobacter psychrophilus]|uniref:DUF6036 domain-containing protein n=1 Tax=Pedobacter psychrophilus TaxID=1826909 RepID=A0A179DD65_9SPHI|nr:DUF6036 family nucleotidyltransferase [Pedobacter psychrophilus]OAQ38469.1 hypothetical protein A5893_13670 [Pedobacter psychrophilus]